jgi:hypothetical protein
VDQRQQRERDAERQHDLAQDEREGRVYREGQPLLGRPADGSV